MDAIPSSVAGERGVAVALSCDASGITVSVSPAVSHRVSHPRLRVDEAGPSGDFESPSFSSLLDLLTNGAGRNVIPAVSAPCGYVAAAINFLRSNVDASSCSLPRERLSPWREAKARQMLAEDPSIAASIDEVAGACGMSRAHFSRSFKISMGLPPHQWLTERRLEAAKRLLIETCEPLGVIAKRCGFGAQSRLSTRFHRSTGMSPRQWRHTFRRAAEQGGWSVAVLNLPAFDVTGSRAPKHIHVRGPAGPTASQDRVPADAITQMLHQAIIMCARMEGGGGAQLAGQIGKALHSHISTGSHLVAECAPVKTLSPSQFARATHLLLANFGDRPSIASVAAGCGISRAHFSRAFKENAGMSPSRWRTEKRIDYAKVLLLEGRMAMVDIAGECGFSEQSHFNRVFLQLVGISPGAWRRLIGRRDT